MADTTEIDAAIDDIDSVLNGLSSYLKPTTTGPGTHIDWMGFVDRLVDAKIKLGTARNAASPFEETTFVDI